jgi:hypothetical protein
MNARRFNPQARSTLMRTYALLAALAAAFAIPAPASADVGGRCHFHGSKPATEAVVADCASQRRDQLVSGGKLDASWRDAQPGKPELVDGKKGKEWRVVYRNPAAADKAKDTLYLFFTAPGNFIAANFTGQ